MTRDTRARRNAVLATVGCLLGAARLPQQAGAQDPTPVAVAPATPAASTRESVEQARILFNEGTALARRGDWEGALARFRESSALRFHAVTLYNIAYCERALGRLTRARRSFREALGAQDDAGKPELPADMAKVARTYGAELEREIVRVDIALTPSGAVLAVDGRPLERSADADGVRTVMVAGTREPGAPESPGQDRFVLELDPGRRVFLISAANRSDRRVTVDLAAGSTSRLELALLPEPALHMLPASDVPTRAAAADRAMRGELFREPTGIVPVAAYVAFGVAAAATVGGAVTGTVAVIDEGQLHEACADKVCGGRASEDLDQARRLADISTASFIAAGGALIVGGLLWLWSDRPEPSGWSLRF